MTVFEFKSAFAPLIIKLTTQSQVALSQNFNNTRETILIVSHEASRTGAPILSLNLVWLLSKRYNVITILLGKGPLVEDFKRASPTLIISHSDLANGISINKLCKIHHFKFALVNTIVSTPILPWLSKNSVPTISLIHEFASYSENSQFLTTFWLADQVIFSTRITRDNASDCILALEYNRSIIIPQGLCIIPRDNYTDEQYKVEACRISQLIRPKNLESGAIIVLGVGTVNIRKGLDLFIECARQVIANADNQNYRFVWIGSGYDPQHDFAYSVYLNDQICRAGLENHVFFLNETVAMDAVYMAADIFVLSSRLDPLPHVIIEAMAYGLPVVCFENTNGMADFLRQEGLGKECVATYMDCSDLANKVLTLGLSLAFRKKVGENCREIANRYFDMNTYIESLEAVAEDLLKRIAQEKKEKEIILASGLYRKDFASLPEVADQLLEEDIKKYIKSWKTGFIARKPMPGFHPGIYLEQHGLLIPNSNPFADYLQAGQPQGAWNFAVINGNTAPLKNVPQHLRIALHIHVYYPDLLQDIMTRLSYNQIHPDLLISVPNESVQNIVIHELKNYPGKVIEVVITPNRGRDIGPLLTEFGEKIVSSYDFIGHVHTKKSLDSTSSAIAHLWRKFLLENLLGGDMGGAMLDRIMIKFQENPSIGMIFPDDPWMSGWDKNFVTAQMIAAQLGIHQLPKYINFSVGTMFWARTSVLIPLINLKFAWNDYPEEPIPIDGTLLHALERLFPLVTLKQGLQVAVTNVEGITR